MNRWPFGKGAAVDTNQRSSVSLNQRSSEPTCTISPDREVLEGTWPSALTNGKMLMGNDISQSLVEEAE